jgi:hypothetical protein
MNYFRQKPAWILIGSLFGFLFLAAAVELLLGRSLFGPDGRFGWWEANIWSRENSQRWADPYSFSHIVHGFLFYAFLMWAAPGWSVYQRLGVALGLEAGWEVLENSPIIINRYRAVTIALGYDGDSVLNSLSDILMMTAGFLFASRVRVGVTIVVALVMEIGCAIWVRDNLTLNVLMLLYPIDAIKSWQLAN